MTQLGLGWWMESFAAWVLAWAGALTGWLHLRLALRSHARRLVRCLWSVAGLSLLFSMALAAAYGSRFFVELVWLDIPWMRALHGTANVFGFGLASLAAWALDGHQHSLNLQAVKSPA